MTFGVLRAVLAGALASLTVLAAGPSGTQQARSSAALVKAVKAGDAARVERLIANGMNPNARDAIGMTPLHYAAYRGEPAVVAALIAGGADPDVKDAMGMTPLHAAAFQGHPGVVGILLKAGADVNANDRAGNTPLHYAVYVKDMKAAKLLLASGADGALVNARGASAAAMARASGETAMARLFESPPRKKVPRVITNDTLAHMKSDGHFVVQEGQGRTSTGATKTTAHGRSRRSGKTVAEKVNADYARIDKLLLDKRTLSDEIPTLEKACDDFQRVQRGEQVDASVGSGPPDPNTSSSYSAYKRKLANYQERLKKRLQATCGKLGKVKSRMSRIDIRIARLREEILQLDAQ